MIFQFELNLLQTIYSRAISSQDGATCMFYPTCSAFTTKSIKKYGLFWGILMGSDRIQRCNPLSARARYYPIDPRRKRFLDPVDKEYIFAKPEAKFTDAPIGNISHTGDFAFSLGLYKEAADLYVKDYISQKDPQLLMKAAVAEVKARDYRKAYALLLFLEKEHGIDTHKLRLYVVLKGSGGEKVVLDPTDVKLKEYSELIKILGEFPVITDRESWKKADRVFSISKITGKRVPPDFKSPFLGATLSIIPGLGKMYAGRTADGIASIVGIGLNALTAYLLYRSKNYAFLVPASVGLVLYLGNIYGGYMATVNYNRSIVRSIREDYAERLLNEF